MEIAIIGAGNVGSTLGAGLHAAGHRIHYARRSATGEIPEALASHAASVGDVRAAVERSELVILATPWNAAQAALNAAGELDGKVLLDATNPIGPGLTLTHGHTDSGAEQVQRWAPTARVVKVFNSTGRENMESPKVAGAASLMLACGDDDEAVMTAVGLAKDLGFDAHAFGALTNARLLEPLALVWIKLALQHGLGRGFAFALLHRDA